MDAVALDLDGGPRSVHDARAWVRRICADLDRADLADTAELAISELVTNALLHGDPPVRLRAGGTSAHLRFEVSDASPVPPRPRPDADSVPDAAAAADDLDALLEQLDSFGRGLALVARASVAWGAEVDDDGKTVWFEPATELAEREGAPFRLTTASAAAPPHPEGQAEQATVTVRDVPIAEYARFRRHISELGREIRLLSLARDTFPQATVLTSYFDVLEAPLRAELRAQDTPGLGRLEVRLPVSGAAKIAALVQVLDAADEFCRSERLLTLPRSDAQRSFQTWLLGEIADQLRSVDPAEPAHPS